MRDSSEKCVFKPSYVTALNNCIYKQERTLKDLDRDIETLKRMIKEWKASVSA